MTVKGPRVHDFTDPERQLPVEIDTSPIYELLLGLFVLTGEKGHRDPDQYEEGPTFFERVDESASSELKDQLATLSSCGGLWLSFIGDAHELPAPRSVEQFIEHLAEIDPTELRLLALRNSGINERRGHEAADLAAAAAGDSAAIDRLLGDDGDELWPLLSLAPEASRDVVLDTVRRYYSEVFAVGPEQTALLERDAADKRILAKSLPAERLVEAATGGVTFQMAPSVSRILLIPSVVIRPWAVISEHGTTRIFCYSVSDARLVEDPEAPPTYLVEMYKALGDEKRLRLLTILAGGDSDLKTLAERVDLAKSTTHHHLRILRSAGLVRVLVGDDDKKYSLRKEAIAEAGPMLEHFIIDRPL